MTEPSARPSSISWRRSSVPIVPRRLRSKRVVSTSQSQLLTVKRLFCVPVAGKDVSFVRGTAASMQACP